MYHIVKNQTEIEFNEKTLQFTFRKTGGTSWKWQEDYAPCMECEGGTVYFRDGEKISHEILKTGVGEGIVSTYEGFRNNGHRVPYKFQTVVWVEEVSGEIYCEWIPVCEEGLEVKKVFWPGPMAFEEKREDWYTLLPNRQGVLIPNTWEIKLHAPCFDGFFGTAGAYMPWFSQIRERGLSCRLSYALECRVSGRASGGRSLYSCEYAV